MYQSKEDVRLRIFNLTSGAEIEELNRLLEDPEMNVLSLEVRTREESNWKLFYGTRKTEMIAVVLIERIARKPAAKRRSRRSAARSASRPASESPAPRGGGRKKASGAASGAKPGGGSSARTAKKKNA